MRETSFIIPKSGAREVVIQKIAAYLLALVTDKDLRVTVAEKKSQRSLAQNAYLWGVVYPRIIQAGGEALAGWDADDLHEYFLGEHFGWETLQGFGRKRMRPIRRSSKLSTLEFMTYLDFIQRRMAEHGIYIPNPNEDVKAA